jgi:SAM-dependent methyltransferase/NAD(P)-dependent dehydrogenase (short-subunit alcohol dehydrogenase family)/acyl carrier protein
MLNDEGILRRDGDAWQVVKAPPSAPEAMELAASESAPEWILLSRCGPALGRVLRGVQEPLELLFPGGDSTVANRLYAESPRHKVMNRLVEMTISSIVKQLPAEYGLRIIEIGAGTGGTTAGVLPLLPPDRTEYLFTDLGAAFLGRAQERFGAYEFVQYKTLDIERLPATQDVPHGVTDLVIAANVLHATTNLHSTIANVRALLRPEGKLVLLEATHDHRWVDLTFGMTDGWWRYADERSEHPLLTAREWVALLQQHGFSNVEVVEKGAMAIFVAQANPRYEVVGQDAQHPPWLLFAENRVLAERLFHELKRRGESAICVFPGETNRRIDVNSFEVRADCRQDYEKLFALYPEVRGVVLLAGASSREFNLDSAAKSHCATALTLVQALLRSYREPKGFWLVTQDAQAVVDKDSLVGVAQAGLWGMGRVIALEHPELNCTRIDVSTAMTEDNLAARLCVEFLNANVQSMREDQIALRECGRYVARLRRFSLPHVPHQFVARPDATYAVTGAFGGLGLATATWLVERGAKHLLLLGRHEPSGTVRERLEAFHAKGIHITVARADVRDRDELGAALARIDVATPLRGVFHSVGVLHDSAILQQDFASFDAVLGPKIQGAWNLYDLTKDIPLDLFVFYSAGVGLLGNRGQANHAAANTLLDAFAHYLCVHGRPAIAIDWGAWAEIGAAAELIRQNESQIAKLGLAAIAPEHGIAALDALLAQQLPPPQVAVVSIDWSRFATHQSPFFEEFSTIRPQQPAREIKAPGQAIDELLLQADPQERIDILRKHIQHTVAQTLHMKNAPPVQVGFSELGMDSLLSIEFRRRLEKELRRSLPSTIAFEYPTVETLAEYLVGEYFSSHELRETTAKMQNDSLVMATAQIDERENDAMTMALEADDDVAAKLLELEALLGD